MSNILFCIMFAIITVSTVNAQWKTCNGPYGGNINTIASSGTTLFTGTENGVYRSLDSGKTWSLQMIDPTRSSIIIHTIGVAGSMVVAASYDIAYYTVDNGEHWTTTPPPVSDQMVSAVVAIGDTLFIATGSKLNRSTNKGQKWTVKNDLPGYDPIKKKSNYITSLAVSGSTLVIGTAVGVYRSEDIGEHWIEISNGITNKKITHILTSGSTILAGTYDSGVFRSTDNGDSWMEANTGLPGKRIYELKLVGSTALAIVADSAKGKLYKFDFDSGTWTQVTNGSNAPSVEDITGIGTFLFAGCRFEGIYSSRDLGVTWEEKNAGHAYQQVGCLAGNSSAIFTGTIKDGIIYRSTDEGNNWTTVHFCSCIDSNYFTQVKTIASIGETIFAGVFEKGIYRSTNNGEDWEALDTGSEHKLVNSISVRGQTLFATYDNGETLSGKGLFRSDNLGKSWTKIDNPSVNKSMEGVYADVGQKLYVAVNGVLILSTNDGKTWKDAGFRTNSGGINTVFINGSNVYAGYDDGVAMSTDNGEHWMRASEGLNDEFHFDYENITSIAAKGNTVFAGSEKNGVFISYNNGQSWSSFGLENQQVFSLLLRGNTLYASTSDSGVCRYDISTLDVLENMDFEKGSVKKLLGYPNPTSSSLTIDCTNLQFPENTPVHYTLSTLIGGKVMEFDNSEQKFTVSLDGMASGVYSLTAVSGGNRAAVMVTVVE